VYVSALALILGGAAQYLFSERRVISPGTEIAFGAEDILYKIQEFWGPYFLIFPAAVLFDWMYSHVSKPIAVAVLLGFVMYPWTNPTMDLAYFEHSIVQEWAKNLFCAKVGWWGGLPDRRWVQSSQELELSEALRKEIKAGRITTKTHIVHVTPRATIWQDVLLHSVYTGIDDDIYVIHPDGDLNKGGYLGSRVRPIAELPAALSTKPPYIVVFQNPSLRLSLPPAGYQEIFRRPEIRLFRRDDLAR